MPYVLTKEKNALCVSFRCCVLVLRAIFSRCVMLRVRVSPPLVSRSKLFLRFHRFCVSSAPACSEKHSKGQN